MIKARIGVARRVHFLKEYDASKAWGVGLCGKWAGSVSIRGEEVSCVDCLKAHRNTLVADPNRYLHFCHARPYCLVPVPPRLFACKPHWLMLPKHMRDAIWEGYLGPDRCGPAHLKAMTDATKWLHDRLKRKHTWYKCSGGHEYPGNCQFCDGGLGACTVCDGFEGTLTTECPGRKITPKEEDAIYKQGTLDFIFGEWWTKKKRVTVKKGGRIWTDFVLCERVEMGEGSSRGYGADSFKVTVSQKVEPAP